MILKLARIRTGMIAPVFLLFSLILMQCAPAGIIDKGGFTDHAGIVPEATQTRMATFRVICPDTEEIERRKELPEEDIPNEPAIKLVAANLYDGGCEVTGQASQYYLFHLWPVTGKIDPQYAIATAVQSVEGDTMIRIRTWHESHGYSLLGHARVFKAKGDVIRFDSRKPEN